MRLGHEASEPMHLRAVDQRCSWLYEGCLAVSERPIIPISSDKAEHDVLPPDSETLMEIVDNLLVEPALLLDGPTFSQRQLDKDDILEILCGLTAAGSR